MTQNKDLKAEIRAHMRATNSKYTEARRAVLTRRGGTADAVTEVEKALQPGRITAILSGGGGTNFGLALPALGQLLRAGHPLVHTTARRDGLLALPGDFDFAIHLGIASETEVVDGLAENVGFDALMRKMEPMMRDIVRLESRCTYSTLVDVLSRRGEDGQHAVLWVQDFDDGGPVALGRPGLSYRDELAAQMPTLRRLIEETGAAMAMGHLDHDLHHREEWWSIPEHADTTFVSAHDWEEPASKGSWLVFDKTVERGIVRGSGQMERWRSEYMRRRRAA